MSLLNKRVQLVDLTTAELNGKQGVVSHLNSDTGRYNVLLDDGSSKAILPKNLAVVGGGFPGGSPKNPRRPAPNMPNMPNIPGMNSPQMQEAMQRAMAMLQPLQSLSGPPGIALLVIFGLLVVKAGFLRGLFVVAVLAAGLVNGLPHFQQAGGGVRGIKAAVRSLGEEIAHRLSSALSHRVNVTPLMGQVALALIAFVLVQIVLSSDSAAVSASSNLPMTLDEAYALGWQDATNNVPFGTSKPVSPPVASSSGGGSGGFGVSGLLTIGLLAKTGYDLGKTPYGWDPRSAMENAKRLPSLQIGLLAFMTLRLFGLSPI